MGKDVRYLLAALAVLMAAAFSATVQAADTKRCAEQGRNERPLSDKLGQSNGVICPPDIDTGMSAPTPDAGNTPVIPPPGSPGGNPNVQPK
jgi:hypothetical protein